MYQDRDFQWGGSLHRTALMRILGIQESKLPSYGLEPVGIGYGLRVFLKSRAEVGPRKQRLYIHCICGRHVTSGCMAQHLRHSKEHK